MSFSKACFKIIFLSIAIDQSFLYFGQVFPHASRQKEVDLLFFIEDAQNSKIVVDLFLKYFYNFIAVYTK